MGLPDFFEQIYLYIYRLPLIHLYRILVYAALILCAVHHRHTGSRWLRPGLKLALAVWGMVVLWVTLLDRGQSSIYEPHWLPLYSYLELFRGSNPEIYRSNIMNAALFYPGGLLLAALLPRERDARSRLLWTVLLLGLFSLGIELSQYWLQCGFCETDDLLHNALGAATGFAAFRRFENEIALSSTIALE